MRGCDGHCKAAPPGLIPLLILRMAYEGPIHGYQVIERVKEMTSGEYTPEPGVIYTALRRMEKRGLLKSRWEERPGSDRRVYEITEDGVYVLKEGLRALISRKKLMEDLFDFYEKTWGD